LKGRWLDGKSLTLPELVQREKEERKNLAAVFGWDKRGKPAPGGDAKQSTAPKAGTFAPGQ
jgi:hypothetical protein